MVLQWATAVFLDSRRRKRSAGRRAFGASPFTPPLGTASSGPSRTEGIPVATKKPPTHATSSPADCRRLGVASVAGNLEEVKRLLSLNVDASCRWLSLTPLIRAARHGHRDVVELLVSKGADVSQVDYVGDNALHRACFGGDMETVKFVLSLNVVDINCRGRRSWTPVMQAARWKHREVVELLVGKGADVSLVNGRGNNILHLACAGGHLETVEFVLSLNVVDINARNNDGETAADVARRKGHTRLVDLLVSRGAQ
ncbi:histone-lysine N-methyltransferase EHMT1-like [Haliotis cracherodii]|uniref:histone-lysine N-methyltransferase EHMT1-like n=1 Tax=Haliotis cracherodii TaxID=6455 RepID=UPI0039ED4A9A